MLLSSLDWKFKDSRYQGDKYKYEGDLLKGFYERCFQYLRPGAKMHIELARVRWDTHRTTGTLFVARHFSLPTRAIDWTENALTALFFACRREPSQEGVVWYMDLKEFRNRVASQWRQAYGKEGNIEDDFERDFIIGKDRGVLVPVHFPPWMPRAASQEAFITVASGFGVDHARRMHELGVRNCQRLVIPARLKSQVIEKLDMLGVNGYTLEIGDSTVETIATDIASDCLRGGRPGVEPNDRTGRTG
jgi:hypothetical protein